MNWARQLSPSRISRQPFSRVSFGVFLRCRCFKDILEAEEERVETGLAIEDMEATGAYVACRVFGIMKGREGLTLGHFF